MAGVEPHRIGLMARPRGDDDLRAEIEGWRDAGVHTVVSLLEGSEVRELGLKEQRALCAEHEIEFRSLPIPDRGTPQTAQEVLNLVAELDGMLTSRRSLAIHCRAGIGRTGLVAGCLLHRLGTPLKDVFHILSRSRGLAMPDTAAQVEWFHSNAHLFAPGT